MSTSDDDRDEWLEERAAIREFDAGMTREAAEAAAELDWRGIVDRRTADAQREIHAMAGSARRSIGQRVRRGMEALGQRRSREDG